MSGSRLRPYLGPVMALLVVLALGAGAVYAAIPNGNGKYFACLLKDTGTVRLINYPKVSTCPKGQKLISWNAKGPQGPTGPQGPQGPAGASGSSSWGDIANKPAGFADGTDDVGYISVTQSTTYTAASGFEVTAFADHPIGTDVDLTIIPEPGKHLEMREDFYWRGPASSGGPYPDLPDGMLRYERTVFNSDYATPVTFKVRARVYATGIAPAALKKVAKQVKVGVVKVPKHKAKAMQQRIGR